MKKVSWPEPHVASRLKAPGTYGSYQELQVEMQSRQAEHEAAQQYFEKAAPVMNALFEYKLAHGEPLIVMRPFRYETSELVKGGNSASFQSRINVIMPGTQIILKSVEQTMQQFIFADALGNEHEIGFVERKNLLTQTNVFEETKSYLESKGV